MTDKEMAHPPGFAPHGKRWRIVKRIPKAILPHYAGETHLRYPIDAANESAAKVIAWRWHAETEETFERIREAGRAAKTSVPTAEVAWLVDSLVA